MFLSRSLGAHIVSQLRYCLLSLSVLLLAGCASDQAAPVDTLTYAPPIPKINTSNKTIVLLVPSQGDFGKEGQMIQAGFMKAYQQAGKNDQLKVITIDTSNYSAPNGAYKAALQEQPDLIVGPLTKPDVNALLTLNNLSIATLALNQVDVSNVPPLNLYQFSLSPQSDAQAAAQKMQADGFKKVLVIAPGSTWGQAIATSFGQRWLAANNQIVDSVAYSSQNNITDGIPDLFQKNSADIQNQTAILVIASSTDIAKIMPILKQYGKNLPIYTLPMSYDGSNASVLNGVHFAVSPWDLQTQSPAHLAFQQAYPTASWRDANLYAFGLDAYTLADYAVLNNGFYNVNIEGQMGSLTIDTSGIVQRKLIWITDQNGQLVADQQPIANQTSR